MINGTDFKEELSCKFRKPFFYGNMAYFFDRKRFQHVETRIPQIYMRTFHNQIRLVGEVCPVKTLVRDKIQKY